jgi:repressor LexA
MEHGNSPDSVASNSDVPDGDSSDPGGIREGEGLSLRQREIKRFIARYIRRNGHAPSLDEIALAVGLKGRSSVHYQLAQLIRKGHIRMRDGLARTIVVLAEGEHGEPGNIDVPLVGQAAAGTPKPGPSSRWEDAEEYYSLPEQLVGKGSLMAVRVRGDSMIDAAIADGDLVVVRRETDVSNGDIVAAMLPSDSGEWAETTIKTFKRLDGHVWLVPQNPVYEPIEGDGATILGKVVSVIRTL